VNRQIVLWYRDKAGTEICVTNCREVSGARHVDMIEKSKFGYVLIDQSGSVQGLLGVVARAKLTRQPQWIGDKAVKS